MHRKLDRLDRNAAWIPVASSLGRLCNAWAKRHDLTVYLGADGGGSSPAFFDTDQAEIEINSTLVFPDMEPTDIGDLTDRVVLADYPVAGGVALHESMHARFSEADWSDVHKAFPSESSWTVFKLLEEMRVEKRGADLFPKDACYLQASTKALIFGSGEEWKGSPRFAAQVIYGRWVAGVLTAADVEPVVRWLKANGWAGVLDEVRSTILEFAALEDSGNDLDKQIELALELDRLMPRDPQSADEPSELEGLEGLIEAVAGALGRAERNGLTAVIEAGEDAAAEAEAEALAEVTRTQDRNKVKADTVFRTSDGDTRPVPMELAGSRQPTLEERSAGVVLAQALDRVRYRDRDVHEYWSEIPPGRLHGGEAMRLAAARWAGAPTSGYRPFKKMKRIETEEPRLTVGIMADTSGSMEALQPAVGSAAWVISDAVYRIDRAEAAQVYFGTAVKPGLQRGERLREVRTWSGGGAYEDFDGGFRSLDGELTLLEGSGARLLFVISDGQYKVSPTNQVAARDRWLKACTEKGVAVVWIQRKGQGFITDISGVEVVGIDDDLMSASREIGQACINTLARVSGVDSGGW